MNRRYTKEQYLELVDKIREAVPDISLTTDIIVGFPGETEEDFEETMDVVRKVGYDSAFTFIFSKRTGTPAAAMEDQVPEDVIKQRFDRLLKEVQTIAARKAEVYTGTTQKVLVETVNEQDEHLVTGRLSNNSVVHLPGNADMIGKIVSTLSGDVLEIDENGAEVTGHVPVGNVMVDGLGVGDVGNIVLRDRQRLAEDGIIIVVMTLENGSGQVLAGPDIVSRGFV